MTASISNGERARTESDRTDSDSSSALQPKSTGPSPFGSVLSDAVLLQVCRVPDDDPQITRESLIRLRIVPQLVGRPRPLCSAHLEPALTHLASVLGALTQFNPTHLPFGYSGPRMQSRGWVDRDALERVAKQIVGLMWPRTPAETVATAVQHAVSESIRLGFLEEREYDAWRPGMRSGSGWRSAVATTPYGAMKACSVVDACPDRDARRLVEPHPAAAVAAAPTQSPRATAAMPRVGGEIDQPPQSQASTVTEPSAGAEKPCSGQRSMSPGSKCAVDLGRPGEPCVVLGRQKKPLTDAQYAIISTLIRAGDEGLTKDALEAIRASARRILKTLRQDADWAKVILMPGRTNGRYRLKPHVHQRPPFTTSADHQ